MQSSRNKNFKGPSDKWSRDGSLSEWNRPKAKYATPANHAIKKVYVIENGKTVEN